MEKMGEAQSVVFHVVAKKNDVLEDSLDFQQMSSNTSRVPWYQLLEKYRRFFLSYSSLQMRLLCENHFASNVSRGRRE